MSYQRGWQAMQLHKPDKIPHTEYLFHRQFTIKVTGLDPESPDPGERSRACAAIARELDYDFLWTTFPLPYEGPSTEMGHGQYTEKGIDIVRASKPFESPEEVLAFEPERDLKVPSVEQLVPMVRNWHAKAQEAYPEAVVPGGFYNSVFTWAIRTFGWELFLAAAALDEDRFDKILEGFTRISMKVVQAHVQVGIPVFLCHDDIVWTSGAVFHPDWYRRHIFPRLKRLWEPLREAGIKVLFCSDGDFTDFVQDLAEAGAQGFIFEPLTDLEKIVDLYGQTMVIIGNIDTRILTYGTPEDIRADVKRCAQLGLDCPGYFFAVGNHIPYNVPIASIECYLEAIDEFGKR